MNRRRSIGAVAAAAVLAAVALGSVGSVAATAEGQPASVSVDTPTTTVGADLVARGSGFAPSSLVLAELCGNEARRGSPDCDQSGAVNLGVGPTGQFTAHLRVAVPPVPCPCVVRVTPIGSAGGAMTPVTVVGAPTAGDAERAAAFPQVVRSLEVAGLAVEDSGSWTAWFGASPRRTLVLTLRNSGTVAVDDAHLVLAVGKSADPSGAIDAPALGALQPGEQRVYRIPFELGPLAFGTHTIRGAVPGLAEPLVFSAHTSSYPWGLIVIPAVLLGQWLLLRVRNRVRDRIVPAPAAPATSGPPAPATSTAPVEVPGGSTVAEDWQPTVDLVAREAVQAVLLVVGDRLLTRGEMWSLADAVSTEVGSDVAGLLELDAEARRTLVHTVRARVDDALSRRELRAADEPMTVGAR